MKLNYECFSKEMCAVTSLHQSKDKNEQAPYTLGTLSNDGFYYSFISFIFHLTTKPTSMIFQCYTNWMYIIMYA